MKAGPSVFGFADGPAFLFEDLADHLADGGFVFHHQYLAGLMALLVSAEHGDQSIAVDRLGHIIGRAQSKAHFFVVEHGQNNDRYFGDIRVGLQGGQHRPAIHLSHENVERNQIRFQFLCHADSLFAVRCNGHAKTFFGEETPHQIVHGRVVVNDQNGAGPRLRLRHQWLFDHNGRVGFVRFGGDDDSPRLS